MTESGLVSATRIPSCTRCSQRTGRLLAALLEAFPLPLRDLVQSEPGQDSGHSQSERKPSRDRQKPPASTPESHHSAQQRKREGKRSQRSPGDHRLYQGVTKGIPEASRRRVVDLHPTGAVTTCHPEESGAQERCRKRYVPRLPGGLPPAGHHPHTVARCHHFARVPLRHSVARPSPVLHPSR